MTGKKKIKNVKSLKIEGPMTVYEIEEIHKKLIQAFEQGKETVVDLTAVTECDTSGIQILYSAAKTAKEKGVNISFLLDSEAIEVAAERIGVELGTLSGIRGG